MGRDQEPKDECQDHKIRRYRGSELLLVGSPAAFLQRVNEDVIRVRKFGVGKQDRQSHNSQQQPGEQRTVLTEVEAEAMHQVGGRIPESGGGRNQSCKNNDVARPINTDRGGSQIEPTLHQRLGVADIAASVACIGSSVDGADGCSAENVGG